MTRHASTNLSVIVAGGFFGFWRFIAIRFLQAERMDLKADLWDGGERRESIESGEYLGKAILLKVGLPVG